MFHLWITLNIHLPCLVDNLKAFWFIKTADGSFWEKKMLNTADGSKTDIFHPHFIDDWSLQ